MSKSDHKNENSPKNPKQEDQSSQNNSHSSQSPSTPSPPSSNYYYNPMFHPYQNQSNNGGQARPGNQYRHPHASSLPYQHVVHVQQVPNNRFVMYNSGRRNDEEQQQSSQPDAPPQYSGFSDIEIRKVFVRKVYLILMVQLLFTLGVIALFIFEPHVRDFVRQNAFTYWIAFAIFFGVYIGLVCSGNLRRKFPTNIILLMIFTLAASYMFATISSHFNNESIFMAVGICAVVCFAVTLFSFNTKFDFTSCGGMLCILLLILILFGIIAIFVQSKLMTMIYAGLGAIVFTMYLAYDTQMLMGGKSVEIHPEEHIFAAIQIYLDILYIFMFILMLLGLNND